VRNAGGGYQGIAGASPLPAGAWSTVALVDDGVELDLYENGVLVENEPSPTLTTATGNISIGCDRALGTYFKGRIAQVQLYARALTAAEVGREASGESKGPVGGFKA
jgi:hypothetical protein